MCDDPKRDCLGRLRNPARLPESARFNGMWATQQFCTKKPTIVTGVPPFMNDVYLVLYICAYNDYAVRAILRFLCHCAVYEHDLFRKFFGEDHNVWYAVKQTWQAGLVYFMEGNGDEGMVEYDWREDKLYRDERTEWLSHPSPPAHRMMLRSDRNINVCRADLFHPDRPRYNISEHEYFKQKRQQLHTLTTQGKSPFEPYRLWVPWVCKMRRNPYQCGWKIRGGWKIHVFFGPKYKFTVHVRDCQSRAVEELWDELDENGQWPGSGPSTN